jgi:hypothetical protein
LVWLGMPPPGRADCRLPGGGSGSGPQRGYGFVRNLCDVICRASEMGESSTAPPTAPVAAAVIPVPTIGAGAKPRAVLIALPSHAPTFAIGRTAVMAPVTHPATAPPREAIHVLAAPAMTRVTAVETAPPMHPANAASTGAARTPAG